jgi:peptidoglycan/LPS O-acetylase OafA/YrhL
MDGAPSPNRRLTELDALRGIAALGVVLFHFSTVFNSLFPHVDRVPFSFAIGEYGVMLFFAISGFVILLTLNQTKHACDFLVARFARLYPAFWFSLALTSVFLVLVPSPHFPVTLGQFLANLTMFPIAFGVKPVDTSYWTLAVELLFYLSMILMWQLRWLAHVERMLIGWILLRWGAAFVPGYGQFLIEASGTAYMPFFAIGIASYRIWSGGQRWVEQTPMLAVAVATVFVFEKLAATLVWLSVLAILAALIAGKLSWVRHWMLLWLGQISYPLYLIHSAVGCTIMVTLAEAGVPIEVALAAALTSVILTAAAISVAVERPMLRIVRSVWKRRQSNKPPFQAEISC